MLKLAEGANEDKDAVIAAVKSLISSNSLMETKVTNLTNEKTALSEQINNLNTQVANLNEMATVGKNHIASLREEVVNNYKKLKGDNIDETIVTMLNSETTGLNTLISLNKDYKEQLEEKFPLTCSKCGSHEVTRGSSAPNNLQQTSTEQNSSNDIFEKLYFEKLNK